MSEEDSSRAKEELKCKTGRVSCEGGFLARKCARSLIITGSFQEALIFLQLILVWIRDNKQPINGGLNQEMELESAAKFSGWRRLITPLLQLRA